MTVKINLGPLLRLQKLPLSKTVKTQWAARYRAFARRRFANEGNRTWKQLSPITIKKRRKGSGPGKAAKILWDTGTLIGALAVKFTRKPGSLQEFIRQGVRVGFGGPGKIKVRKRIRKKKKSGKGLTKGRMKIVTGKQTIAYIAAAHNFGRGVPQRKIIVQPDEKTSKRMVSDVERDWKKQYDRAI